MTLHSHQWCIRNQCLNSHSIWVVLLLLFHHSNRHMVFLFVWVLRGHVLWPPVGVRGQVVGVSSLLPPFGPEDLTLVIRLGSKNLYKLSNLGGWRDGWAAKSICYTYRRTQVQSLSTHIVAHKHLQLGSQSARLSILTSVGTRYTCSLQKWLWACCSLLMCKEALCFQQESDKTHTCTHHIYKLFL